MGTALHTDHYELTMLDAALHAGMADRRCAFEVFARELPAGRRFGVVAGLGRLLRVLDGLRFSDDDLRYLADHDVVTTDTVRFLEGWTFDGDVDGFTEGEAFVPNTPVLTVTGRFGSTVILETLVLSILNHDSAIAAAAARMRLAAGDRGLLEFGSRRTHEEAATAAARSAMIGGFTGTSNLEAGRRYGIPTLGTSAHAFSQLFDDEQAAFEAQVAALGPGTTLLVDTWDTAQGVRTALAVVGARLGGVRLDSGDLAEEAQRTRATLDAAGATRARIVASGDLDEHRIADLDAAPIDAFGVGTQLVVGSGAPTAGFIYKLAAREDTAGEMVGVWKDSPGKATIAGAKRVTRALDRHGIAVADHLAVGRDPVAEGRPLQQPLVVDGRLVDRELATDPAAIDRARKRLAASLEELPERARDLTPGRPCIPTVLEEGPA